MRGPVSFAVRAYGRPESSTRKVYSITSKLPETLVGLEKRLSKVGFLGQLFAGCNLRLWMGNDYE